MKALVKATGEIVELLQIENDCNGNPIYKNMSKSFYGQSELEFDHVVSDDYWKKLKHQAAIVAMQGLLQNRALAAELVQERNNGIADLSKTITRASVIYADELIRRLNEK